MNVIETKLKGCFIIEPRVFQDNRGCFFESFNQQQFNKLTNTTTNFVQDNESFSSKGVLRGLHYQLGKFAQAKLVRVVKGKVLDVAVDIREDSETFGKHVAVELSAESKKQLFVPRGFAHGLIV
ncbi:dTDP-4-dehydrorhamnose 3,5-epimerase, partial [Winogradskyella sp.]|uniref:dTDP-4-dehydrorhamnose 3,5-epimerase n=1 Tax=Winogradskyella sp. TaxID=1883156 RepID=UPI003F6A1873